MEKTAMNELIKWTIKNAFNITGQDGVSYTVVDYEEMRELFDGLLEKERQQIINAHESGFFRDGDEPTMRSYDELTQEAQEYYDKTFKSKQP